MAGNGIGQVFRLTTFGESHGSAIGGVIDGCPSGMELDVNRINLELARRRPGQSAIVTQRKEPDKVEIMSGLFEGKTTGTPIGFIIRNKDQKSRDYNHIKEKYRPSHADYTYDQKFGFRDYRGGGRSSARETACRVVAGGVARQILEKRGIRVWAYVSQVGAIKVNKPYCDLDPGEVDSNIVRCPEQETAKSMIDFIKQVRKEGDTTGGQITGVIQGMPSGVGEPVFDKLHADLGKAMLSINAVKGFEYGSGFEGVSMKGSEHNDVFKKDPSGNITTKTNYSGGIQGGISNGEDIYFNVAFKPVATLMKDQPSVDRDGNKVVVQGKGRHDPCVVPRAVPIVEAMALLIITDHLMRHQASALS